MTTYSKADLRNSALEEIKVKDAGETAAALDSSTVDAEAQRVIENLEDESLLIFDASVSATTSNIPGRIFNALRDLVAESICRKYGIPETTVLGPHDRPESLTKNATRRLRRSILDGSDDVPVKAQYF